VSGLSRLQRGMNAALHRVLDTLTLRQTQFRERIHMMLR